MVSWIQQLFRGKKIEFTPTFSVPPCTGKRWAIGDIHGCYRTFLALLEQLKLSKSDQLFLLGDLVNKGYASAKVLDQVMQLQQTGYQVFVICGNHEQIIVDCALDEPYKLSYMMEKFHSTDLLQRKNKLKTKYLHFFQKLPYYLELEKHFLVHAGFNFKAPNPFTAYDQMIWIREFKPDSQILKNKHLIRGHLPRHLSIIKHELKDKRSLIHLDNGCVYWKMREGQGNLLALELNSWELVVQECQDFTMLFGSRMPIMD